MASSTACGRTRLILECHHVAGDDDFLLKVRARSLSELESVLADELKGRLGIARTRTTIVLGTAKETARLPVGPPAAPARAARAAKSRAARRRPLNHRASASCSAALDAAGATATPNTSAHTAASSKAPCR